MNGLLWKIDKTGSVERKASSGRWVCPNATEYLACFWADISLQSALAKVREIEKLSGLFAVVLCYVVYAF